MASKSAFCCASLRTGTLIIAWVFLVVTVLNVLLNTYVVESSQVEEEEAENEYQNSTDLRPTGASPTEVEISFKIYNSLEVVYGMALLNVFVLAFLLYGTYKKLPVLLMPFVVVFGASTTLTVPLVIYWFVMGVHILVLSPIIISIPICFYSVRVVWNYYKQLRAVEDNEPKSQI